MIRTSHKLYLSSFRINFQLFFLVDDVFRLCSVLVRASESFKTLCSVSLRWQKLDEWDDGGLKMKRKCKRQTHTHGAQMNVNDVGASACAPSAPQPSTCCSIASDEFLLGFCVQILKSRSRHDDNNNRFQ